MYKTIYKTKKINKSNIIDNDLKKYIIKLLIFCNNYYKYDLDYIKLKFNINSYSEFTSYFKEKYKIKLIFNSINSENLFINFLNMDKDYFNLKYNENCVDILLNFFILKEDKIYFNKCNELFYSTNKTHIDNCNCKIKVKSIVNIDIITFTQILSEDIKNKNKNININIFKINKNEKNIKLIDTFNKLEEIGSYYGISHNVHYTLESSEVFQNNLENKNKIFNIKNNIQQFDSELIDLNQNIINSDRNMINNNLLIISDNDVIENDKNNIISNMQHEKEENTNIKKLYNKLVDLIDINNNLLIDLDEDNNLINLISEIKEILDIKYFKNDILNLRLKFNILSKKILSIKILENSNDMQEYYNLYNDVLSFKNYL